MVGSMSSTLTSPASARGSFPCSCLGRVVEASPGLPCGGVTSLGTPWDFPVEGRPGSREQPDQTIVTRTMVMKTAASLLVS
jgi:hypothetical protein